MFISFFMCLSLIQPPILHQLNNLFQVDMLIHIRFSLSALSDWHSFSESLWSVPTRCTAAPWDFPPSLPWGAKSSVFYILWLPLSWFALSLSAEYVERFWYLMKKVCVMFLCELKYLKISPFCPNIYQSMFFLVYSSMLDFFSLLKWNNCHPILASNVAVVEKQASLCLLYSQYPTSGPSDHQRSDGFSHAKQFSDTRCLPYNFTQFWHYLPQDGAKSHSLRVQPHRTLSLPPRTADANCQSRLLPVHLIEWLAINWTPPINWTGWINL